MVKKIKTKTYEDAVSWFRNHGFDVLEAPGTSNRVFLKKYHVSAAIERTDDGGVKIFAYPGYLISGEISKLVDHGYQKVLKTTKAEYPATADHLKALHQFAEELKEGTGAISLYNEALGPSANPTCTIVSATVICRSPSALSVPGRSRRQPPSAPHSLLSG